MRAPRQLRLAALALLVGTTGISSILGLVALNSGGEAQLGGISLLRIAAGYDRAAEPLLRGRALLSQRSRREASALSRAAIRQFPYDTSAWLRLAYVDYLDNGRLTPAGLNDLTRSYDLVAIDPFVGLWRVRFALENSQALSPALRSSVRAETFALWRNEENQQALRELASSISNPAGRLSAALWLNQLERTVAK